DGRGGQRAPRSLVAAAQRRTEHAADDRPGRDAPVRRLVMEWPAHCLRRQYARAGLLRRLRGHAARARAATRAATRCHQLRAPDGDVEELALSRDGRHLAYTVNVDGFSELRLRDTETGALLQVPPLPRATYSQLAWSGDGRRLALVLNGARYNPDVWVLDLQEERAWQVTRSARGGIPREDLVEPEVIRYPTFDGRQIPAL